MLETVELPGSLRRTTRLGFGGSGLMGGLSERESLLLLETAFDAGIRHFDVAPSYGHGMAERCLGRFLRGKFDQVTVTTKYGILPPARAGVLSVARNLARPLVRRLPTVRKHLAHAAAGLKSKAAFSVVEAQQSLHHSLTELGVDRVDLFLLHEAAADDLDGSDLLPWLQQMHQRGCIGAFGIGSERAKLSGVWQRHAEYCQTLQFECSVLEDALEFPGAFCLHHRTISGPLAAVREMFGRQRELCRQWSNVVDADLADTKILAGLLLTAALLRRSGGIVLFSSRTPSHIRLNADMAHDPVWADRAHRLLRIVRESSLPVQ